MVSLLPFVVTTPLEYFLLSAWLSRFLVKEWLPESGARLASFKLRKGSGLGTAPRGMGYVSRNLAPSSECLNIGQIL